MQDSISNIGSLQINKKVILADNQYVIDILCIIFTIPGCGMPRFLNIRPLRSQYVASFVFILSCSAGRKFLIIKFTFSYRAIINCVILKHSVFFFVFFYCIMKH